MRATAAAALFVFVVSSASGFAQDDASAAVAAAEKALSAALAAGDNAKVAALVDDQYASIDSTGRRRERRELLTPPLTVRAGDADENDVAIRSCGDLAIITGNRPATGAPAARFLRLWVRHDGAWRALLAQDTPFAGVNPVQGAAPAPAVVPAAPRVPRALPFAPRSDAEREVAAAYQAMEAAIVAMDVAAWTPLVADEFQLVGQRFTGKPATKAERIAALTEQRAKNAPSTPAEVRAMSIRVIGDAAVMFADQVSADGKGQASTATRVFIKRDRRWQLLLSQQTPVAAALPAGGAR